MEEAISTETNISELNEKIEKESSFIDLIKISEKTLFGSPWTTRIILDFIYLNIFF